MVLAKETIGFFQFDEVSLGEFFGGTEWNPLLGAEKHFGIWPLVAGTLLVTVIAASFALPLGLIAAIPAYIAFNHYSSAVGRYTARLEAFADDLSTAVQRRLAAKV